MSKSDKRFSDPNVVDISGRHGGPPGGGGEDPPDDMKERIEKLETEHRQILDKLVEISASLRVIDTKLDAKADAATLERTAGEMRLSASDANGKLSNLSTIGDGLRRDLDKLPNKFDVATIIVFVVGGLAAVATLIKTVWPHVFGS